MACPNCIKKEDITKARLRYICIPCEDIISKDVGIENIDDKYKYKKKGSQAKPLDTNVGVTSVEDDEDEDEEDDDDNNDSDSDDDESFANRMSGIQGKNLEPKNHELKDPPNDPPKDIICKHYSKGSCFHGFSGSKPHGD